MARKRQSVGVVTLPLQRDVGCVCGRWRLLSGPATALNLPGHGRFEIFLPARRIVPDRSRLAFSLIQRDGYTVVRLPATTRNK